MKKIANKNEYTGKYLLIVFRAFKLKNFGKILTENINGAVPKPNNAIKIAPSKGEEVAMALAMRPKILMLDEPAAGISPTERGRLVDLLKSLDKDMTLVLIEHDMAVALAVADEVIVMHDGTMFMQGSPDEIRTSSAVRDLYLGSNHE